MIIKQKGIGVFIIRFAFASFGALFLILVVATVANFVSLAATQFTSEIYVTSLLLSVVFAFVCLLPVWLLLWLLPDVRVHKEGIEFRALMFRERVSWKEIAELIERNSLGFSAIRLRRSQPLMFWNRLYGFYIDRPNKPIVILSIDQKDFDIIKKMAQESS